MKKITILISISFLFFGVTYAQTTAILDSNFEQALIDFGYDTILDGSVLTANINTITSLDVSNKNISDLTGIEDFTDLLNLNCSTNQIFNLNVTQNLALTELRCQFNNLTGLDVSANTALTILLCNSNNLTGLDVSANTALTVLYCFSNSLTSLDISANTALNNLRCQFNNLTSLDVSVNTSLTILLCTSNNLTSLNVKNGNNTSITDFSALNNPNLTCIEVDNASYSTTNWTNIDTQTSFNDNCEPQTFVPDDNFEQTLIDLGYDSGVLDDFVPTTNINTILTLDVSNKNIFDFTGINSFTALQNLNISNNPITQSITFNINNLTALTELRCLDNQLTSLDVSANTALTLLWCNSNNLTSLDISNNTALTYLQLPGNQLTYLDVSNNSSLTVLNYFNNSIPNIDLSALTNLQALVCGQNQINTIDLTNNSLLTTLLLQNNNIESLDLSSHSFLISFNGSNNYLLSLNIANGNNSNFTQFITNSNQNLICIEVDNVAYSTTNWTDIDTQTSFNVDCNDSTCNNTENITVSTALTTVNFDLTNEPVNNEMSCDGTALQDYADLWYEFTMPVDGNIYINGAIIWNNFVIYEDCSGTGSEMVCEAGNVFIDNLNSGTNYKLRVYRTAILAQNTSFQSFSIQAFERPTNDDCNTAESISVSTSLSTISFNINGADINNEVGCEGTAVKNLVDVWYEFTMPVNGNIYIDGSIVWNNFALYDTCNGTEIHCEFSNALIENLTAGTTYKLRVFRAIEVATETSFQSFTIQAFESAANDNCNTAQNITVSTTATTIDFEITGANSNNEGGCNGTSAENYTDIWYEFTMPQDGAITIDGSINWNNFALYDSCNGTELGCFNDNGTIANLVSGNTYKLRVFRTLTNANQSFKDFTIQVEEVLNIETFTQNEVSIFPNPATNIVIIQTPQHIDVTKVEIFNISGKQIQTESLVNNTLNINHLNSGLFFIAITANQNTVVKKLIIK